MLLLTKCEHFVQQGFKTFNFHEILTVKTVSFKIISNQIAIFIFLGSANTFESDAQLKVICSGPAACSGANIIAPFVTYYCIGDLSCAKTEFQENGTSQ